MGVGWPSGAGLGHGVGIDCLLVCMCVDTTVVYCDPIPTQVYTLRPPTSQQSPASTGRQCLPNLVTGH